MAFNSYAFLLFFPIVVSVYFILPKGARRYWLLITSYYFYMSWNAKYAILILLSTIITYFTGVLLKKTNRSPDRSQKSGGRSWLSKIIMGGCIALNLGILFFFKYYRFFFDNLAKLFDSLGIELALPVFDVLLPVGISFYTFQAIGYCIDVYRGDTAAEKDFVEYALFVSFFPQLVAGPIERSGNLLHQLKTPKSFSYSRLREGAFLMLWGFFQKIVVADRIAIYVDTVYGNYSAYPGVYLIVASVLFAFQIYCDFCGYSNIAKGAAHILGIELMNNFESPYLSGTCGEFWRRWHISLSSWFKDYVYIPLGGNRKGRTRKYINLMIVFMLSGLWHGANWTFIVWGLMNGFLQIVGDITKKARERIRFSLRIRKNTCGNQFASIIVTFILIDLTWVFFRAESISDAFNILKSMITVFNPWVLFDSSLFQCGLSSKGFVVLGVSLFFLFIVDVISKRGLNIIQIILRQDYWFRVLAFGLFVCLILVFGIWGTGYESDAFLYFQF